MHSITVRRMARGCAALALVVSSLSASAIVQPALAASCSKDAPTINSEWLPLVGMLGDTVGQPTGCAAIDNDQGEVSQKVSNGTLYGFSDGVTTFLADTGELYQLQSGILTYYADPSSDGVVLASAGAP